MIQIRQYQEHDRQRVEEICIGTSEAFRDNPLMKEALLKVFCHYYIETEPQNCFVAVDEADEAVGYVLCAENFARWEKEFTEKYLEISSNPVVRMMGAGTVEGLRGFAGEYPAHLHIDLDECCQRQGLGTRLMNALTAHLREKGISGVMLNVASDNEKGTAFYRKYGFEELECTEQEIAMGYKL